MRIVADLKDFSHVDKPEMVVADLHELIDKTLAVASNEIKYKAEIVRNYGEVPPITCYGGKISQVVLNFIMNAAQAIEEQGTITIQTGCESDKAWFEVRDTGCGIPAEILSKVYDPFFTTKPVGEGTGLGLHMVHKIVEAHQGSIHVESTEGEGTTFRVTLPVDYSSTEDKNTGLPSQSGAA
ncbi:MAG: GHKL domain-containing protein [Phycisphaeraceae bacterium]|nr:GHKL domain-containing protein [Phycisphaeraceae bacterium]